MNEKDHFEWIRFYKEFALNLLEYRDRKSQGDLYSDGYEHAYLRERKQSR